MRGESGQNKAKSADPFAVVYEDGSVSRERFDTEYLAQISVPAKDRDKITIKKQSELEKAAV